MQKAEINPVFVERIYKIPLGNKSNPTPARLFLSLDTVQSSSKQTGTIIFQTETQFRKCVCMGRDLVLFYFDYIFLFFA